MHYAYCWPTNWRVYSNVNSYFTRDDLSEHSGRFHLNYKVNYNVLQNDLTSEACEYDIFPIIGTITANIYDCEINESADESSCWCIVWCNDGNIRSTVKTTEQYTVSLSFWLNSNTKWNNRINILLWFNLHLFYTTLTLFIQCKNRSDILLHVRWIHRKI